MNNSSFFKFENKNTMDMFKGWNDSCVIKLSISKNEHKNYEDFLKIDKNCSLLPQNYF